MNHKRPQPIVLDATRARPLCPVCGHPSYSREGIHPQCAQEQSDGKRMKKIRAVALRAAARPKPVHSLVLRPWHRRCPKCNTQLHISKKTCGCGHEFQEESARS